jgi:hypothetical protein
MIRFDYVFQNYQIKLSATRLKDTLSTCKVFLLCDYSCSRGAHIRSKGWPKNVTRRMLLQQFSTKVINVVITANESGGYFGYCGLDIYFLNRPRDHRSARTPTDFRIPASREHSSMRNARKDLPRGIDQPQRGSFWLSSRLMESQVNIRKATDIIKDSSIISQITYQYIFMFVLPS